MSLSVGPEVEQKLESFAVEVPSGKFVLYIKPVSDDDMLKDDSLCIKWYGAGVKMAPEYYLARERHRLMSSIQGWSGVTTPTQEAGEVDLPFTYENLRRLLRVPGVLEIVRPRLLAIFEPSEQEAKKAEGESKSSGVLPVDSSAVNASVPEKTAENSSIGTSDAAESPN